MISSSSSRRETIPENNKSKSIGCMSCIFRLVCKYQNRRKFLTSAEKKGNNVTSSPATPKTPSENKAPVKSSPSDCDFRRFSCDVSRSPAIPSDIRRSNSVSSPENFRRPPAVVARLMGLDEIPASPSPESSAEKRRKLLGALQKCDEDLKALKKIIESIRSGDHLRSSPPVATVERRVGIKGRASPVIGKEWSKSEVVKGRAIPGTIKQCLVGDVDDGDSTTKEKRCSDINSEQPSPVSVLDGIFSSPSKSCRSDIPKNGEEYKKLREDSINLSFFHRITVEALPRLYGRKRDDPFEYFGLTTRKMMNQLPSPFWSSKAMVETVNEVCQDAVWEERWELGRIGVVLEDYMFGELIEEVVRDLGCFYMSLLPFEACRRRLRF